MSSRLDWAMLSEAGLGYGPDGSGPIRRRSRRAPKDAPVGFADDREYREARIPGHIEYRAPSSADDYLAWSEYSKEPGQRTDAPLTGLDGPERRYPPAAAVAPEPAPEPPAAPAFTRDDPPASDAGYDVAMYMFTGIMLILVLEQFVQMGVSMRPLVGADAVSW